MTPTNEKTDRLHRLEIELAELKKLEFMRRQLAGPQKESDWKTEAKWCGFWKEEKRDDLRR